MSDSYYPQVESGITLAQYQREVERTMPSKRGMVFDALVYACGIAGEAGETTDLIKKVYGHGHPLDTEKLRKELGDVLWYVAALGRLHGIGLESIAEANIVKLRNRYPEGFTEQASRDRKE